MLISIMTLGGGHGTPIPTSLCYPIFFLIKEDGGTLVWTVLLGQFPVYGLIFDLGKWISRQYLTIGLVGLLHATLVLIIIIKQGI
jgi:hypothetical protein